MKRWVKWAAFLVAFVLFLVLSVKGTPLSERAIIVGVAVDKGENGYIVTAQVLVSSSGSGDGSSTSGGYVISTVEDVSLSSAFLTFTQQTGKTVALTHCNLVILGMSVLEGEAYNVLDYLTRNAYLSENALLVAAENGFELLETKVAYGEMTSLHIQSLYGNKGDYSEVAKRTVKQYINSYCTQNGANWLSLITRVETQSPETETETTDGPSYVFDMTKSVVIRKNEYVCTLDKSGTTGMNYVLSKIDRGAVTIDGDNGETITLYVVKKQDKTEFDSKELTVTVKLNLDVIVKEIIGTDDSGGDMQKKTLTESEEKRLIDMVESNVRLAFDTGAERGVDVFGLYEGYYRDDAKNWKKYYAEKGDEYLKNSRLYIDMKVKYE